MAVCLGWEPARAERRGIIGIFCRPDHPPGWGACTGETDSHGRHQSAVAHGYVTIMVVSPDWIHHGRVCTHFAKGRGDGVVGIWGPSDCWFGGPYECVFAFEGALTADPGAWRWGPLGLTQATNCPGLYGDNRVFCLYTYEEAMAL